MDTIAWLICCCCYRTVTMTCWLCSCSFCLISNSCCRSSLSPFDLCCMNSIKGSVRAFFVQFLQLGDDWLPVGEGTGPVGGFSWSVVGVCCGDVPAGLARLARQGQFRFSWSTLPQVKHVRTSPQYTMTAGWPRTLIREGIGVFISILATSTPVSTLSLTV